MPTDLYNDPRNWIYSERDGLYHFMDIGSATTRSFPPINTPLSRLGGSTPYPNNYNPYPGSSYYTPPPPTPSGGGTGAQPPGAYRTTGYSPYGATGGLPPARYRTPQYGYGGTTPTSGSGGDWWDKFDAAGVPAGWYNPDVLNAQGKPARLYGGPGNFTFASGAASDQAYYYSPTYGLGTMAVNTGGGKRYRPGGYSGQADQASVDAALEKTGGKKKSTVQYSGEWKKPQYNDFSGDPFKAREGQKRKKPGKGGKTQKAEGGGTGGQAQFNT